MVKMLKSCLVHVYWEGGLGCVEQPSVIALDNSSYYDIISHSENQRLTS